LREAFAVLLVGQTFSSQAHQLGLAGHDTPNESTFYRDQPELLSAIDKVTAHAVRLNRLQYVGGRPLRLSTDTTWAHRIESSESTTEFMDGEGNIIDYQRLLNHSGRKDAPKATTPDPVRHPFFFFFFFCVISFYCDMMINSAIQVDPHVAQYIGSCKGAEGAATAILIARLVADGIVPESVTKDGDSGVMALFLAAFPLIVEMLDKSHVLRSFEKQIKAFAQTNSGALDALPICANVFVRSDLTNVAVCVSRSLQRFEVRQSI
jgi:hypothetical protein